MLLLFVQGASFLHLFQNHSESQRLWIKKKFFLVKKKFRHCKEAISISSCGELFKFLSIRSLALPESNGKNKTFYIQVKVKVKNPLTSVYTLLVKLYVNWSPACGERA